MFSKHMAGYSLIVDTQEDALIKVDGLHYKEDDTVSMNHPQFQPGQSHTNMVRALRIVVGVPTEGEMVSIELPWHMAIEFAEKVMTECVAAGIIKVTVPD